MNFLKVDFLFNYDKCAYVCTYVCMCVYFKIDLRLCKAAKVVMTILTLHLF